MQKRNRFLLSKNDIVYMLNVVEFQISTLHFIKYEECYASSKLLCRKSKTR